MSSLKSSVASGLRDLLKKKTISDNDLRNMLLRFVKSKDCGRAKLALFRGSFFETGRSEVDSSWDVSVEAIVDDLLRLRTQKFHAEGDELMTVLPSSRMCRSSQEWINRLKDL